MLQIDFSDTQVMINKIKKEYGESKYALSILNYPNNPPLKDDITWIIAKLRMIFPSTYDFREAKKHYDVYNHKRLETKYLFLLLKEEFLKIKINNIEKWKEEELKKYNCDSWKDYFEMCGWVKNSNSNSYIKPKIDQDFSLPNVIEPTKNTVLHHKGKDIGYRGKKNKQHEEYIKNKRNI